jgi:hypothetical protein
VVVVEAVWNEIPPLWGAVRLTLWVTVDVHGTVHKVAYQDSESGLAQALPLWPQAVHHPPTGPLTWLDSNPEED